MYVLPYQSIAASVSSRMLGNNCFYCTFTNVVQNICDVCFAGLLGVLNAGGRGRQNLEPKLRNSQTFTSRILEKTWMMSD